VPFCAARARPAALSFSRGPPPDGGSTRCLNLKERVIGRFIIAFWPSGACPIWPEACRIAKEACATSLELPHSAGGAHIGAPSCPLRVPSCQLRAPLDRTCHQGLLLRLLSFRVVRSCQGRGSQGMPAQRAAQLSLRILAPCRPVGPLGLASRLEAGVRPGWVVLASSGYLPKPGPVVSALTRKTLTPRPRPPAQPPLVPTRRARRIVLGRSYRGQQMG
jgi:hypothetical protein